WCAASGVQIHPGATVVDTAGSPRLTGVTLGRLDDDARLIGPGETLGCDLLASSGGWRPVVHLHSQRQGKLRWDDDLASFVPDGAVRDQQVVGAAAGTYELAACVEQASRAGKVAAELAGFAATHGTGLDTPDADPRLSRPATGAVRQLWLVPAPGCDTDGTRGFDTHFVDLQRDSTVADIVRACGTGMSGVEHVKRYTSIGTAHDQGKTSAVNTIGVIAATLAGDGGSPGALGTTTFRAPYTPVAFAALAGEKRGMLFDPARTTSIHSWHVDHGALFED